MTWGKLIGSTAFNWYCAAIAVLVVLFSTHNWFDVTVNLWGDIQADIKIPVLLLIAFLIGWLPTWLILRARIWSLNRRIEALDRNRVGSALPSDQRPEEAPEPVE